MLLMPFATSICFERVSLVLTMSKRFKFHVQRTRGQVCLLWFPVMFAFVEFDLFSSFFLPGG